MLSVNNTFLVSKIIYYYQLLIDSRSVEKSGFISKIIFIIRKRNYK